MLLQPELALVPFVLAIVISIFNHLVRIWQNRVFAVSHGCQPPAVLSRLDNLKQQAKAWKGRTWLEMWCHRYATVATTFESASVSVEKIIFTVDPENIKAILATDFKHFDLGDRRRKLMGPLIGTGIFTSDGAAWEHSRSLIRPTFTKLRVSDLSVFESHFQDLLAALPSPNVHSSLIDVDLQPLFFRMTLDSATEVLLGHSFRSLLDAPGSPSLRFMEAFDYAQHKVHSRDLLDRGLMKPIGLVYALFQGRTKTRFDEACETVHSILDDIIADFLVSQDRHVFDADGAEKARDAKYVFLEEMAKSTRDPIELRYEILNVLIAGRDTTASLLSNAFFMLARHPDVWSQVRTEVQETFGDKVPEYEELRNMKQVRNLLYECLRLYPPVPFNSRCATANTVLPRGGGPDGLAPIFIPAGKAVNYHVFAMHRLPQVFGTDAEEFRPSRWEDPKLRPGWGYIPFNGGPRICLGQQFALTEALYTVVRMMQHFSSIERRDPELKWTEHVALVTKSRAGTKIAMAKATKEGAPTAELA